MFSEEAQFSAVLVKLVQLILIGWNRQAILTPGRALRQAGQATLAPAKIVPEDK